MCIVCIPFSLFFSYWDVWMDLSCSRQPPVNKPSRRFLVSLFFFFFCLWSVPLSGERVTQAVTLSRGAHKHLKDQRVTQRAIHTTWGCTFVICTQGYVLGCVQTSSKQIHAQTEHGAKLEGWLMVDSKISEWQAAKLTAGTIQDIHGTHTEVCFDWWASVAYSLTWFTVWSVWSRVLLAKSDEAQLSFPG